eukprot:scaffold2552_cov380-Prasinococcus_capsulatus_cf.AAC.27
MSMCRRAAKPTSADLGASTRPLPPQYRLRKSVTLLLTASSRRRLGSVRVLLTFSARGSLARLDERGVKTIQGSPAEAHWRCFRFMAEAPDSASSAMASASGVSRNDTVRMLTFDSSCLPLRRPGSNPAVWFSLPPGVACSIPCHKVSRGLEAVRKVFLFVRASIRHLTVVPDHQARTCRQGRNVRVLLRLHEGPRNLAA